MKLTNISNEDLVSPKDFTLVSQDDLYENLVETINNELGRMADDTDVQIFATADASVEICLSTDELIEEAYLPEMIYEVRRLYQSKGWKDVTYEFIEEDEDSYASHTFTFFFPNDNDEVLSI